MGSKAGIDVTDCAATRIKMIETARLLATPIDFEGLVEGGVLASGRGAWYEMLQPELLPAHAWQQATEMQQDTCGDKRRTFVKFSKKTAAAARLYEQLTGETFKTGWVGSKNTTDDQPLPGGDVYVVRP